MPIIITFPTAAECEIRKLDAALVGFNQAEDRAAAGTAALEVIMRLAVAGHTSDLRQRAARWLAETMNVVIAA